MIRFRTMTAGIVVAALLATGVASAQGPRRGGPGRGAGGPGGIALPIGALKLTDAQQQQVRDIRQQEREAMQQLEERLARAREAQRAAIETVPVNEGLVRQTSDVVADIQAEAAIRQAHLYNQVWAVLTPAQQAEAKTLRTERQARQEQRGERRPRRQQ
jgi:protein CpxP